MQIHNLMPQSVPMGLADTRSLVISNAVDMEQWEHLGTAVGNGDHWALWGKCDIVENT